MNPQCQHTMQGRDETQGTQVPQDYSKESSPSDIATNFAPEPASLRAPYQGEDSRVTLLRNFDDKLQEWVAPLFAGKSVEQNEQSDNPITISLEMARFYQLITRGSIQVLEKLQSEKGQLECDSWKLQSENQHLQQHNWQLRAEWHEMKARRALLESEYDQLKVKHSALEEKELEWEHMVVCLHDSNSNLREQLDAVERVSMAQGEVTIEMYAERKTGTREVDGEGRNRKRTREE